MGMMSGCNGRRLLQAASVCSAGGLLEGVSHGSASLNTSDAAVLLLDDLILESCENAAAAAGFAVTPVATGSSMEELESVLLWRDAAGYSCCHVFLVSCLYIGSACWILVELCTCTGDTSPNSCPPSVLKSFLARLAVLQLFAQRAVSKTSSALCPF